MNKYAQLAKNHWAKTDPARYATIENPDDFFGQLGEQAEEEIQQLADSLAGPDPAGEGYLEKVGRLNMARLQAEEKVLAELVWIAPRQEEPDETEPNLAWEIHRAMDAARREIDQDD